MNLFICLLTVLSLLAGCASKPEQEAVPGYLIYHLNTDKTALISVAYDGETEDPQRAIPEMIEGLKVCETSTEGLPVIPEGVELEEFRLDMESLSLYFNADYGKMDTVQEVLCRAAIVRTLTQLPEVELVAIYVDGEPLTDKEGKACGFMQEGDFVQNTGSSINSFEDTVLTLYFADESGERLVKETRSVHYSTNTSKEKLIVEQLIKGPEGEGGATLPKETKLLGVSIKNGVCYLNFDSGLNTAVAGVRPEVTIYSIVNSVLESGSAGSVQISINGEYNVLYQENINLSAPFARNLDIMKEE